jgi:hypothetical protein
MRLLRSHHISKLVEVVDTFFPREALSPRGGRPVILHQNEVVGLLVFSCMVAPQRTLSIKPEGHKPQLKLGVIVSLWDGVIF